jgi:hypothetical protein
VDRTIIIANLRAVALEARRRGYTAVEDAALRELAAMDAYVDWRPQPAAKPIVREGGLRSVRDMLKAVS